MSENLNKWRAEKEDDASVRSNKSTPKANIFKMNEANVNDIL